MADSMGVCVNYKGGCSMFERPVPASEGDTCFECGHSIMHSSGLTWTDARAKAQAAIAEAAVGALTEGERTEVGR